MKKKTRRIVMGICKFYVVCLGVMAISGIGYGFYQVINNIVS